MVNYIKGINSNTYDLLFKDAKSNDTNDRLLLWHEIDANNMVDNCAKTNQVLMYKLLRKEKLDIKKIKFNKDRNSYTYRFDDKDIEFYRLSDNMDYTKYYDKKELKELTTVKRHGKCHTRSISITSIAKDSKLLSGICRFNKTYFHHSVVLLKNGDIVDWTKNLIMKKEDYEKLTNFKMIQSIDREDLYELFKVNEICPELCIKVYLYFRDELIKDMKKHKILKK